MQLLQTSKHCHVSSAYFLPTHYSNHDHTNSDLSRITAFFGVLCTIRRFAACSRDFQRAVEPECVSVGINSPIFAEIVPASARTSIYALDRSFESLLASFAPPVVGVLAEKAYGYIPPQAGKTQSADKVDRENALSLSKALYTAIGAPLTICCLIYTFLYWTYPRDRDRARALALVEAELATSYEFQKFSLVDETELEMIDAHSEQGDESDSHSRNLNSSGTFTETQPMLDHNTQTR